ncbi:hypothetical protein [Marinobacter phage PS6]|nr:hypothetical protein [Marinobacter phage PS6]
MRNVMITPDGTYLKMGLKETHVGQQPYLYETTSLHNADLFSKGAVHSGSVRKMSKEDRDLFSRCIPVQAREERRVVLVHPDEVESEK